MTEPIELIPECLAKDENGYDTQAYRKFNNAIKRMSQPRVVEQEEVDVEFVFRGGDRQAYAVVIHYPDGEIESDMIVKMKGGGWSSYRNKFRYHPNFVSNYIASIYGYKSVSDTQIVRELVLYSDMKEKAALAGNIFIGLLSGGVAFTRCLPTGDNTTPRPIEAIAFIPYEGFSSAEVASIYGKMLRLYVFNENLEDWGDNETFVQTFLTELAAQLKEKYGAAGCDKFNTNDLN